MKVIIAGAGKSGFSVAQTLAAEGHDVTVIDKDSSVIDSISNALDVICVEGSITNPETLIEAGAEDADLLMAAARSDEANMVCGISSKKLGTKHVIARIRDSEYLSQTDFLRETLGLSVIVNPEYECAKEISRILRFPGAVRVDSFSKGSVEIMEHRIDAGSKLDGVMLKDLGSLFGATVLVSVVERDGEAIIPNGLFTLKAGDRLSITGASKELRKFFSALGLYKKPVRSVMIMGGGRIAVYLAKLLIDNGIAVMIMEVDKARCDELCDLLSAEARVICGDATSNDVLLEEGIKRYDAFVALTGDDGDNIITSMYVKTCGVGKVVVKANREYYSNIMVASGLDSIVTPKALVAQQLARYVRAMDNSVGSSMETLYRLADGKAEALEFIVGNDAKCIGVPLKTMKLKENVLLCALVRGSRTLIPDGESVLEPGDHAVVVSKAGMLKQLDDMIEVDK